MHDLLPDFVKKYLDEDEDRKRRELKKENDLLIWGEFLRMKEERELQRWKPISTLFEKPKTIKELSEGGRIPLINPRKTFLF